MSVPDSKIAKLQNGINLAYLDSGSSNTQQKTFVFVHGACMNMHCWDMQFTHLPTGVRAIAYSMRGYHKSNPFAEDKETDLLQDNVDDLISFLDYCQADLDVKGQITLVCWSQGGIFPLATGFYNHSLNKFVDTIVFYEPPDSACWHLPQDPNSKAAFKQAAAISESDGFESTFLNYISGFYDHFKEYLESRGKQPAIESGKLIKTSMTDPSIKNVLDSTMETTHLMKIISIGFPEPKAENAMLGAKKLKESGVKIGIIYGDMTVPGCLLGSWHTQDVFSNAKTAVIPGGNHFVMMHKPEDFWDAVLEVS